MVDFFMVLPRPTARITRAAKLEFRPKSREAAHLLHEAFFGFSAIRFG
jgi:hypothetical protein